MGSSPTRARWRRRLLLALFAAVALYAIAGVPRERWGDILPTGTPTGPRRVSVRAFDVLGKPGQEVLLRAKVYKHAAIGLSSGVPGVGVVFRLDEDDIGTARTNVDGVATLEWLPPSRGEFALHAAIETSSSFVGNAAEFLVACYDTDDRFVVVDFDGTLTKESAIKLPFESDASREPHVGAATALTEISKQFHVLYLTGRDERSIESVRTWLQRHGFPAGVAMFRDYELISPDSEDYKYHELQRLRATFPQVMYGVGDDLSDARAYSRSGVRPVLLGSATSASLPSATAAAASWEDVRKTILEQP